MVLTIQGAAGIFKIKAAEKFQLCVLEEVWIRLNTWVWFLFIFFKFKKKIKKSDCSSSVCPALERCPPPFLLLGFLQPADNTAPAGRPACPPNRPWQLPHWDSPSLALPSLVRSSLFSFFVCLVFYYWLCVHRPSLFFSTVFIVISFSRRGHIRPAELWSF